ncbi:MAG: DMT family transporter [Chloroflexi bacterium]|nr:DMT family transporter [Chloroflexota bacterium]
MLRTEKVAYAKAVFSVIAWGGSFIATKIALQNVSPTTVVWLRFAIGVAILGIVTFLRGLLTFPKPEEIGYFSLLGAIGITFHQWLQSTGLVTSEATTTAWIVASTPIFIALLGWLVLGEKLTSRIFFGIGLASIGVLLVVSKGDLASITKGQIGTSGDMLILLSAPNWAIFSVLSRRGLQKHPATQMMFYVMTMGWLFTSVQFSYQSGFVEIFQLSVKGWLAISFLGIFSTGMAYIFWYDALQILKATQVGAFLYLEPLVTIIAASLLLNEKVFTGTILGGGIILYGVWLVNRPKKSAKQVRI